MCDSFIDALASIKSTAKSDEERINAVMQNPFFMNKLTVAPEDSEVIQAIQALQMEGTPFEIASNFKNQGNESFKEKRYKDAIQFYTNGILVDGLDDAELLSVLFSNRAAVNLSLCNR